MAGMALAPRDLGPRSPWGAFVRRVEAIDAQLRAVIAARRADPGEDVLSQMIAAGLDEDELRDHLVTLIAAGHDTTAGALGWAVERLARDPAALERAHTGDDAWLDAIVRETLRARPVLSVAPRRLAAPLQAGDRTLPAGVHVAPCIYLLQRRADLYRDPAAWRPQRFIDGAPDGFAWIPFGGGVRRCLGAAFAAMEMREVLRAITARLQLTPDRPEGERMRRRGLTLQPGRGARVILADAA
jgi:cytochrome P450